MKDEPDKKWRTFGLYFKLGTTPDAYELVPGNKPGNKGYIHVIEYAAVAAAHDKYKERVVRQAKIYNQKLGKAQAQADALAEVLEAIYCDFYEYDPKKWKENGKGLGMLQFARCKDALTAYRASKANHTAETGET